MKRIVALLLCLGFVLPAATAQTYPSKPVRFIVTFAAGGGTDLVARAVAPRMSENLGQPIVVENRPGANGAVGAEHVAKAAPDGYTVCVCAAGTMVIGPHLTKQPFDTLRDFAPISPLATSPFIVTVYPSVKATSIRELIALAKASPGKINYGSSGVGGAPHLSTVLFESMAGVQMVHVAYKGLGPAMTDLLGGQIQLMLADIGVVAPHLKSEKLRGLAITGRSRSPVFPELPTVAEAGLPGYAAGTWYGLFAPAGTPAPILLRLSTAVREALAVPDIGNALAAQGVEPVAMTPDQFAAFAREEHSKWGGVIRSAGIKLD
jgi:tripartite-type tricarboxylate transporter receptor subunit TctC